MDGKGKPIPGTEEEYTCDTLLLSCGLIPENEISRGMGVDMNPVTSGPKSMKAWRLISKVYLHVEMYCMYMTWWILCRKKRRLREEMQQNM